MTDEYDRFGQILTTSVSAFGVIANALLLVAIKTRSAVSFRTYSTILLNSAAVDLVASTAAALSVTRIFSSSATATTYLIFNGPCSYAGRLPCWISHVTENQMWMTSNYFLCFAFAFRLSSVRKKSLQSKTVTILSACIHLASVAVGLGLFSLLQDSDCTAVQAARAANPPVAKTGCQFVSATIQFHSVWSIVDATLIITSSPIVFAATFVLRHLTVRTLRASKNYMSPTTLAMHRMLIRTLNFQLALTTLMGLGCGIFMAHLLGIADHPLTEVLPCAIVNLLPALAPVLNFSCIRPYRLFLIRLFRFGTTPSFAEVEPSPSIRMESLP